MASRAVHCRKPAIIIRLCDLTWVLSSWDILWSKERQDTLWYKINSWSIQTESQFVKQS